MNNTNQLIQKPQRKWYTYFTIKRSVLLLVLIIILSVLLVFFLGKYPSSIKARGLGYSADPFTTEGFTTFEEYYNSKLGKLQSDYDELLNRVSTMGNTEIEEMIQILKSLNQHLFALVELRVAVNLKALEMMQTPGNSPEDIAVLTEELNILMTKNRYTNIRDYFYYMLNEFTLVLQNDRYNFYFNYHYTDFRVVLKDKNGNETDQVWASNPEHNQFMVTGPNYLTEYTFLSQFNILYGASTSELMMSNYEYSIRDRDVSGQFELTPTVSYKTVQAKNQSGETVDALQVYYHLTGARGGIYYTDFPFRISQARLETFIANNAVLHEESDGAIPLMTTEDKRLFYNSDAALYTLVKNAKDDKGNIMEPYYEFKSGLPFYQDMTKINKTKLKTYFRDLCGYTPEDALYDNSYYGFDFKTVTSEFKVAIQYCLGANGLEARVLSNSIDEGELDSKGNPVNPITKIELLPYFAAVNNTYTVSGSTYTYDGYFVVPDGSGAVQQINSGLNEYKNISKRVYSTDRVFESDIYLLEELDMMLPMGALIQNPLIDPDTNNVVVPGRGILMYSQLGEAQLTFNTVIASPTNPINRCFFTLNYRETGMVTIGAGYYRYDFLKFTEDRVKGDLGVTYKLLSEDQLSVGGVAKAYREHLIDYYGLEVKDITSTPVVNADIIGSYDFLDNFLGIQFTNYGTLTTFSQMVEITKAIGHAGAKEINLYLYGWREEGLRNVSFKKQQISKAMGGAKAFDQSQADIDALTSNVQIYPYSSFGLINEFQESFGNNHYGARTISGDNVTQYSFDRAAKAYDNQSNPIYVLSPRYFEKFMSTFIDSFKKKVKTNAALIDNLGNIITGDYKRHDEIFRYTSVLEQLNAIQMASDEISNLSFIAPDEYAIPYAQTILNLPYSSTPFEIYDYSIPLYQMILSGIVDYSGMSINGNDDKGSNWHLMHILETGSNLAYTFGYDNPNKLILTQYNKYFYTEYTEWMAALEKMVKTVGESQIHECVLVNHERLSNSVYRVTYQSKTSYFAGNTLEAARANNQVVEIILNYSTSLYKYNGIDIPEYTYSITKRLG